MPAAGDIRIAFADGEFFRVPARPGASILAAAEAAGHRLASNCRAGTCRTCLARDDAGAEVFLCVTPAEPGLSLTLPYRRLDLAAPTLRRARINAVARLSRAVWEVRFRLQAPLPFLPGQYVEATFPGIAGPRRFSLANPPGVAEHVFLVRDFSGGAMSAYLGDRARSGDLFTLRGPFGVFYLRPTERPKVFVAGGTGLSPILSMLASIVPGPDVPPLAVVAGFAHADDAAALDRLAALAATLPLEVVATADAGDFDGHRGDPVQALAAVRSVTLGVGTEAYLCGPPGMVVAVRDRLTALGLDPRDVLSEAFVADHETGVG